MKLKHHMNTMFLVQMPGAVHGSSIIGLNLMKNCSLPGDKVINIALAKSNNSINKFGISKMFKLIIDVIKVIYYRGSIDQFVLFYTANGLLLYRDLVFCIILRNKRKILLMNNRLSSEPIGLKKRALKFIFSGSKYIVNSENLLIDYMRVLDNPDYSVIPNSDFQANSLPFDTKEFNVLRVLYLSNLQESKGVFRALEIVKKLKDSGFAITFTIAGTPIDLSLKDIDKKIQDMGMSEYVYVLGPVYGSAKDDLFATSNIFILPTNYPLECFPVSIVEALRHGLLVISARTGGIPSMIKDSSTGYLFNLNSLDKEVTRLIRTKHKWSAIALNGRRYYEKNLSTDKWTRSWNTILNRPISKL